MALNFSVSNVTDYPTITTSPFDENKWHPVTEYLVYGLMSIGMSEINAKNADEVFRRIAIHQKLYGPALQYHKPPTSIYLTIQDIKNHIGMNANVRNVTAAEFNKRVFKIFEGYAIDQCETILTAFGQVAKVAHERSLLEEQSAARRASTPRHSREKAA